MLSWATARVSRLALARGLCEGELRDNLIYDFGLHRGEDTDFYLRKGFEVVAVEANPDLVAEAKTRFRNEISTGKLRLIEGAVAPAAAGNKVVFYANREFSVWSTVDFKWASRNEMLGHPSERTEVKRVDVTGLYRSFGIPFNI